MSVGHFLAVVTSFTCTLPCISPKSNKAVPTQEFTVLQVVGMLKIHITSKSTLWHNMWVPIAFHYALKKTLEFPCQCDLKCVCCQKTLKLLLWTQKHTVILLANFIVAGCGCFLIAIMSLI